MDHHLAECAECRLELKYLGEGSDAPAENSAPEFLPAVFGALLEWERRHDQGALRERLADGLRPYLGVRATARLIASSPEDGQQLLQHLEPVLAQFLGKRTASQLVSRVLDRALARV